MTILEVLIVLVILSLIGVLGATQVMQQLDRAKVDVARLQIRQLENALTILQLDLQRSPTSEEGLGLLVGNPQSIEGWRGPYLKSADQLLDPWGQPLQYELADGQVKITSTGADRAGGGDGAGADIQVGFRL